MLTSTDTELMALARPTSPLSSDVKAGATEEMGLNTSSASA